MHLTLTPDVKGCGGEKLKNAYEKARQFDTMSVGCVFTNVFSSRGFYAQSVSVSACFFYAYL